jgi:hypothetical protein
MQVHLKIRCTTEKHAALWQIQKPYQTLRKNQLHRAERIARPKGKVALVMNSNSVVRKNLLHYIDVLDEGS